MNEVDIIRPLLEQYGLCDVAQLISDHLYSGENMRQLTFAYQNIDRFEGCIIDSIYVLTHIHYFGFYFSIKEKTIIKRSIIEYIYNLLKNNHPITIIKKQLFHKRLNLYCYFTINKHCSGIFGMLNRHYDVKIVIQKHMYGRDTVKNNFSGYFFDMKRNKEGVIRTSCQFEQDYKYRLNNRFIELNRDDVT
jgi:hypothetical protein